MKTGIGYDVHRLAAGRKLIIGGVDIPHEKGLLGHSDADVLVHAVIDAILGAAGLGDIGEHFPDTDARYKGADSLTLLSAVSQKIKERGLAVYHLDTVIIAEAPKLKNYKPTMRSHIARVLGVSEETINIKATTEEGMGFTGTKEGMAAWAVATLKEI